MHIMNFRELFFSQIFSSISIKILQFLQVNRFNELFTAFNKFLS